MHNQKSLRSMRPHSSWVQCWKPLGHWLIERLKLAFGGCVLQKLGISYKEVLKPLVSGDTQPCEPVPFCRLLCAWGPLAETNDYKMVSRLHRLIFWGDSLLWVLYQLLYFTCISRFLTASWKDISMSPLAWGNCGSSYIFWLLCLKNNQNVVIIFNPTFIYSGLSREI